MHVVIIFIQWFASHVLNYVSCVSIVIFSLVQLKIQVNLHSNQSFHFILEIPPTPPHPTQATKNILDNLGSYHSSSQGKTLHSQFMSYNSGLNSPHDQKEDRKRWLAMNCTIYNQETCKLRKTGTEQVSSRQLARSCQPLIDLQNQLTVNFLTSSRNHQHLWTSCDSLSPLPEPGLCLFCQHYTQAQSLYQHKHHEAWNFSTICKV